MRLNLVTLKRGLLLFWGLWLAVVVLTNVLDGFKELGTLPASWPLASGNFQAIVETTKRYGPPVWVNAGLFAGAIAWEVTALVLMLRAAVVFDGLGKPAARAAVDVAFAVNLALWAAMMLADEVCIAYPLEGAHRTIFVAQLVTLLAVRLLPDE